MGPPAADDLEAGLGNGIPMSSVNDEQQRASTRTAGFHRLAKFVSINEHGIIKRFDYLALLNILYLQSELWHLQVKLEEQAAADAAAGGWRSKFELSWYMLKNATAVGEEDTQWQIVLDIRKKLDEYYAAVLKYSKISDLRRPTDSQRQILSEWIRSESLNQGVCLISSEFMGVDGPSILAKSQQDDLVLLQAREEENDMLARCLVTPLFTIFHAARAIRLTARLPDRIQTLFQKHLKVANTRNSVRESEPMLRLYPAPVVQGVNRVVGALFSAATPLVSMLVLFWVDSMAAKLGLVCLFTVVFCLCLSFLSKARRIEIFAATAT